MLNKRLFNKQNRIKLLMVLYLIYLAAISFAPTGGMNVALNKTDWFGLRADYWLHALFFIPLAPLWYTIWSHHHKLLVIFYGLVIAALSEFVHYYLPYRAFNINDLYANMSGVVIGALLYMIIKLIFSLDFFRRKNRVVVRPKNQTLSLSSISDALMKPNMTLHSLSFPLKDVTIYQVKKVRRVKSPVFSLSWMELNQHSFWMQIDGVGSFYACDGNEVEVAPAPGTSQAAVRLYLEGSVYGAILHQRKILPLHGSCFIMNNKGIMICGGSGIGKSSLTASFCLNGGEFLSDDVTPVVKRKGKPHIMPHSTRIKLWDDSLEQLGQDKASLDSVTPGHSKYYYPMKPSKRKTFRLDHIFIIEAGDNEVFSSVKLDGISAFTALRNEIYRWEYLPAMPKTEAAYLNQLIDISRQVSITRVKRPKDISIEDMQQHIKQLI